MKLPFMVWSALVVFFVCTSAGNSFGQESTLVAQPAVDPVADIQRRLSELEAQRATIEKEIASLKEQIAKIKSTESTTDSHQAAAKKACGCDALTPIGTPTTVGDLTLTLESLSYDNRRFAVKKRFDFEDKGARTVDFPMWGVIVKVDNGSKGRVSQPFNEDNMFGGRAQVIAKDNWDNSLAQASLESSEYEIGAGSNAGFATVGAKVLPEQSVRFFIPLGNPEVDNVDFFVVRVNVRNPSVDDSSADKWFFVPKSKVVGLEAAVAKSKEEAANKK